MYYVYLVFWTVVGTGNGNDPSRSERDWRVLTTHGSAEACHKAARSLNLPTPRYRCISGGTGGVVN
jgi:hypothetical protein